MTEMRASLTCREFADFIADYLEDDLAPVIRQAFEEHLGICPSCVAYLTSYSDTIRLAGLCADDREGPPADAPEDLVQAILAARKKKD